MLTVVPVKDEAPFAVLRRCRGYYECPHDSTGKRIGPLVGYAGKYLTAGGAQRNYVGEVYVNFAKAERHMPVLTRFAGTLHSRLHRGSLSTDFGKQLVTGFCGAPEGGKALAVALGSKGGLQYIFPEKKVTALETPASREESVLRFDRHEPERGDVWWITEDVCNNFSTTFAMIELIESYRARVGGIVCFLNRSLEVDKTYTPRIGLTLPVVSVLRRPIRQYKQDDPFVAADIANGNVIWKPKDNWAPLEDAMRAQSTQ